MANQAPYELVITRDLWERAVPRLLVEPHLVAVGICRRNEHHAARELLVQDLELVSRPPVGRDRAPLSDWVVLGVPGTETGDDVAKWTARLQPRDDQMLCVALLGLGSDRSTWSGVVVEGGRRQQLQAVRVIGPGMLRATREPHWRQMDEKQLVRWSRTRGALGEETWEKVADSRVMIFGAGRNGSALAFYLAALGARRLVLVDPDTLNAENLDAEYCATEADVGQPKVAAIQKRLVAFHSECAVTAIPHDVTHAAVIHQARDVDLIATCVDHDAPRLAGALLARRFLKVHLDVGTGITRGDNGGTLLAGDARLLLPRQGCVLCVGGLSNEEEARVELFGLPSKKRRKEVPWHEQRAGSLITLNSMTVSIAAQLWLDLLAGSLRTSHWHRLRWEPGGGIQADHAAVGAAAGCRVCRG